MTGRIVGWFVDETDAVATREALEVLVSMLPGRGQRPSAKLAALVEKYPKTVVNDSISAQNASGSARIGGGHVGAGDADPYAVMSAVEAAKVLGITPNGVRDLARRGRLRARRAGGRWLLDAHAVVDRANR